ncbi:MULTISPECIES: hypothetical protein [unclassified Microbacterium]|uniref:hypothetical protein n=1 Tax=unclassified Microbacterium TaxID=2609290 RepID=UPI0016054CAF|nr:MULTISPECIES: hypothetical protein [unclassified Microbacterium]QNA92807.1 hypothetical protein G4G29_11300 [Microbacterium sp. Se63.02b]QYM62952.1 hypothetical protein K1X59_11335 [Microbacterium sp. Se5.02b]
MTQNAVLERILSDADPATTPRDALPDARARATRDRILRTGSAPRRRRTRTIGWTGGVTAAVASTALAFAIFSPQGAAVAGTPAPLDFSGSNTIAQLVDDADAALAETPGPTMPLRTVKTASWSFSVDVDTKTSTVAPQLSTLTWEPDGSGRMIILAGVPYDPTDAVASNAAEVTSSGEVVTDLVMAPGDFDTPWTAVPGETRDDMVAMLRAFGMPEDPTAYEVEMAFAAVLDQWTLTDAQHRELLLLLEEAGGGDALGTSTDRLGRTVTGVRVQSPDGAVSDLVLVSRDTGRIVGVERTVLTADELFPAGAIISYQMWDLDEETIR